VQDKLRLGEPDGDAAAAMRGLLAESARALLPQIVETTHRWAQYWR
jgi:phosphatidylinositol 3-kinase